MVLVAPVYAAGEEPIEGADAEHLVAGLKQRGHRNAQAFDGPDALPAILAAEIQAGDMIVCLGAGDITKWAATLADKITAARGKA